MEKDGKSARGRSTATNYMGMSGALTAASSRFTLDTNLLVYAVDRGAGVRHEAAVEIIPRAAGLGCI